MTVNLAEFSRIESAKNFSDHEFYPGLLKQSDPTEHALLMRSLMAFACLFCSILFGCLVLAADATNFSEGISSVSISRDYFNPALRQDVKLSFSTNLPGLVTVHVIDQKSSIVRYLVSKQQYDPGVIFHFNLDRVFANNLVYFLL